MFAEENLKRAMEKTIKAVGLQALCLFCSVKVSENNSESYRLHLRKNHNFDKHIEETISQTFDGKYFLQSGDIFYWKTFEMYAVDSDRPKRAIEISNDTGADDPSGNLMKFIDHEIKIPEESISDPDWNHGLDSLPSYECENCNKISRRMITLFHVKTFNTST